MLFRSFNTDCAGYQFFPFNNPLGDAYTAVQAIDDGCCIVTTPMTYVPDLKFQAALSSQSIVSGWWDITGTTAVVIIVIQVK